MKPPQRGCERARPHSERQRHTRMRRAKERNSCSELSCRKGSNEHANFRRKRLGKSGGVSRGRFCWQMNDLGGPALWLHHLHFIAVRNIRWLVPNISSPSATENGKFAPAIATPVLIRAKRKPCR